jgi:hypothetical protein
VRPGGRGASRRGQGPGRQVPHPATGSNEVKVPAGYIPLPSDTYEGYALLRSIPKSGHEADVAKAVAYGKRIKIYPLSDAATPPVTTFVDVVDVVYDATIS